MVHLVRYESLSRIDTLNKVEYFKTSNICMTCLSLDCSLEYSVLQALLIMQGFFYCFNSAIVFT